ncbi:VOC family protein [Microbacterium sp. GXF0217]
MDGVGEMLTVRSESGAAVTCSCPEAVEQATGAAGDSAVQPIWFQEDLAEPRAILEALGLRAGLAADRGGWVELRAEGGTVGLHTGAARNGLGFEARGDLDALAARLRDAGFDASVVDEAFARTIRIPDPDGGDEIWINGVQEHLHGYHREG